MRVVQKVDEVNALRLQKAPGHIFSHSSSDDAEVRTNPALALSHITAVPRMAFYMEYSTKIYDI